jgi:PAS domain S-box-containing protein
MTDRLRTGGSSVKADRADEVTREQFWSVIDNLNEVVFQTDAQGRWTFLNRAWEEITGFSVAESLGRPFLEFVYPEDRNGNIETFRPLIEARNQAGRHDMRYMVKSGGFRWMEVHARLTTGEAGEILGTAGTLSDVTERRQASDDARRYRQKLEFVLASNPAVIFIGQPGANGTAWETTFISDNVRTILGFEPEQFTSNGEFWLSTIHPDDMPEVQRSFADMAREEGATARWRGLCGDGTYRWLRCDTRVISRPDGARQTIGCLVDETKTRLTEESLKDHAAVLDAVGFAAQRFLDAASWRREIHAVLNRLGAAARSATVAVYQNEQGEQGDLFFSRRAIWYATEEAARGTGETPGRRSYRESGCERWMDVLGGGGIIHGPVRNLAAPERAFLEQRQFGSVLIAPIFSGRNWWGFIGFADDSAEREWLPAQIDALKAAAGILGAAIRREQTESELRYSGALLRATTEASPLGFCVVDHQSERVLYFNNRFCEIWGLEALAHSLASGTCTSRELTQHCLGSIEDGSVFTEFRQNPRETESALTDCIHLRDGRTIRRFSRQIRDGEDNCFGHFYMFEDVTEQQRAEEMLRRSHSELECMVVARTAELEKLNDQLRAEIADRKAAEYAVAQREAQFRTLIENSSDIIFVANPAGTIDYVSPTVERALGYAPDELIGRPGTEFIDPRDVVRVLAQFQAGLKVPGNHPPLEFQARHKDGSLHQVEAVANNQLENAAVGGIVITLRDITERRRLEDQFRHAQKMEAVGRLAGGIAHDFNNLLTVICGYGELLGRKIPDTDPLSRKVAQIRRAADRATGLIQQLLAFSRKQVLQPMVLDINEALRDLEQMLRRLIGEDIDLSIATAPEPVLALIDKTSFDQIVMNLSVNARDAMPAGGTLSISTGLRGQRDTCQCATCRIDPGDFAVLVVRDNGIGMSDEVVAHIFEPFFTTKELGKGTGLGLPMVFGAVQQTGGHICVDSVVGRGSTFQICLPRVENAAVESTPFNAPQIRRGDETILLVEDETMVRTMMLDALEEAGYNVLQARDGEQALELAARREGAIDLLLTDVVMPKMSGRSVAESLSASRPDTRVLYVSGYARQELTPDCRFLQKPFSPDELIREVQAVLSRTA